MTKIEPIKAPIKVIPLPGKIGIDRFIQAWLIGIVLLIVCWAIFLSIFDDIVTPIIITLLVIPYLVWGSVFPPERTIQAVRLYGEVLQDRQIEDEWTWLPKPFMTTENDMRFESKIRRISIRIRGITSDKWAFQVNGYAEYIIVNAPKMVGISNHEKQIESNLAVICQRAGIGPFGKKKAELIEQNRHKLLSDASQLIEETIKTEPGYDDNGDSTLAMYGIDVPNTVLDDIWIDPDFYIHAKKKSQTKYTSDAIAQGIAAISAKTETEAQRYAADIMLLKEKLKTKTEVVNTWRVEDPDGAIAGLANRIGTGLESAAAIMREAKALGEKFVGGKKGKPKVDPEK